MLDTEQHGWIPTWRCNRFDLLASSVPVVRLIEQPVPGLVEKSGTGMNRADDHGRATRLSLLATSVQCVAGRDRKFMQSLKKAVPNCGCT